VLNFKSKKCKGMSLDSRLWFSKSHIIVVPECLKIKLYCSPLLTMNVLFPRFISFDPSKMGTPESKIFENTVMSILGLEPGSKPDALLSSLPCELIFNDLRDVQRRHSKMDKVSSAAMHVVAHKSMNTRSFGCTGLEVTDMDWAQPLKRQAIKTNVHQATRCSDISLGICSNQLTKNKSQSYTKPHVFTARLEMMHVLQKYYFSLDGDSESRRSKIYELHSTMWISKIIPCKWFIRKTDAEGNHRECNDSLMVIRSGPYFIEVVEMQRWFNSFRLVSNAFQELLTHGIYDFEVSRAEACVDTQLTWKRVGEWMSIPKAIAFFTVEDIPCGLLSALCSRMKLAGHAGLSHKLRAELFMKHMKVPEERIAEVLAKMKTRQRKKKNEEEGGGEDWCGFH